MKIKDSKEGEPLTVYGFYFAEYQDKFQKMYWYIPRNEDYPGLITIAESECELVDNTIDHFCVIRNYQDKHIFLHKVLSDSALLEKLVDHQPEAMSEFKFKLSDFYKTIKEKDTDEDFAA